MDQERDAVVEQALRSHYGVEQEDSDWVGQHQKLKVFFRIAYCKEKFSGALLSTKVVISRTCFAVQIMQRCGSRRLRSDSMPRTRLYCSAVRTAVAFAAASTAASAAVPFLVCG